MGGHVEAAAAPPAYLLLFVGLAIICAAVVYMQNQGSEKSETSAAFKAFQWKFLSVYFLATLSDWLQVSRSLLSAPSHMPSTSAPSLTGPICICTVC